MLFAVSTAASRVASPVGCNGGDFRCFLFFVGVTTFHSSTGGGSVVLLVEIPLCLGGLSRPRGSVCHLGSHHVGIHHLASRKHAYIILTPLSPTFI